MRDSDLAYNRLRLMITTTKLKPGQVLVESELMSQLNMGRTPIREALNRLAAEKFIRIIPRQCMMVGELSLQDLEALYQIRSKLSELEGELAAAKRTGEELEALKRIVEEIRGETDWERRMMLDREFHQAITRMTKNSFLEDEMNITLDLCLRLLFLNQDSLGSGIDSTDIQEYESIYQALWDQNAEELVKELKKHIYDFRSKFLK